MQVVHNVKIKSSSIVVYPSFEYFPRRKVEEKEYINNFSDNKVKGNLSHKSKSKMKNQIDNWLLSIQAYMISNKIAKSKIDRFITFVTLTLPSEQFHTDYELKRNWLNIFLIELKRKYNVTAFIWKLEKQKNGNAHFHILINKTIDWKDIRKISNRILKQLGYIEHYALRFRDMPLSEYMLRRLKPDNSNHQKILAAYNYGVKTAWQDPNSTDIHGLYKIKNVPAYISKYMSKSETNKELKGRLWGCSDNLKLLKYPVYLMNDEFVMLLNSVEGNEDVEIYHSEYYHIYSGSIMKFIKQTTPTISKEIQQHYLNQFHLLNN